MSDRYPKVTGAVVQAAPVFLDREATVEKACALIADAARRGAEIIAFPECYIPGFPHWFLFHSPYASMRFIVELFKNAVEIPSPAVDRLCEAARNHRAYVVMGINERVAGTLGTLYNTMLFIGRDGEVLGRHRKIMPTFCERLVHAPGDASGLRVYPTAFGGLGGLICGENTNPLAKFALFAQGEKIHVASWPAYPTAANRVNREGAGLRSRAAAFEGKVFVLAAGGVFDQRMTETMCDTEERRRLVVSSGGTSAIVGPGGEYLAGPLTEGEGILVAEMDLEQIVEAKISHDVIGHYNRPDLFALTVERRPRALARFLDPAAGAEAPAAERAAAGGAAATVDLPRALLERLAEMRDEEIGRALRDILERAPHPEA